MTSLEIRLCKLVNQVETLTNDKTQLQEQIKLITNQNKLLSQQNELLKKQNKGLEWTKADALTQNKHLKPSEIEVYAEYEDHDGYQEVYPHVPLRLQGIYKPLYRAVETLDYIIVLHSKASSLFFILRRCGLFVSSYPKRWSTPCMR